MPSASVLLTPENSPEEEVSLLIEEQLCCAPHSLEILRASEAQYPLMMSLSLSHNYLQDLKLVCSGSPLRKAGAGIDVGAAAPQRQTVCQPS